MHFFDISDLTECVLEEAGDIPLDIPSKLKAEDVIMSESKLKGARSWKEVFKILENDLKDNQKKLIAFAKVLLHYKTTILIGRKLLQKYCKLNLCFQQKIVNCLVSEKVKTPLSPTYNKKLDELLFKFGGVKESVRSKMTNLPTLSEFKERIGTHWPYLKPELTNCATNIEVLKVIEGKCSLTNVSKLEDVAKLFNCQEALKEIKEFEKVVDDFCDSIRLNVLCGVSLAISDITEPLNCEKLEFVLQWEPEEHTLKEIEGIIWKTFEDISGNIIVLKQDRGQSVVVVCYIPHTLVPLAVYKAQKNIAFLRKMDVTKLTIGYFSVIDEKYEKVS